LKGVGKNMSPLPIRKLLSSPLSEEVTARGWIYRVRSSGAIVFAVLRDSSGIIQVTVKRGTLPEEEFQAAHDVTVESSVVVKGKVFEDRRAPGGRELQATGFAVVGAAQTFPITEYQSEELLLDHRHLWIRSREQTAIMKIKASAMAGAREWLKGNEFSEVTPPILTQNACEGGGTLFKLKYFDREAYLSQSAQMYLEALIFSLERVYSITPSFRAEKSRTPRHLTEYWHLELEEAWVDNIGNMEIQEQLVTAVVEKVLEDSKEELLLVRKDIGPLKDIKPPFKRMTYSQAIDKLRAMNYDIGWGCDLGAPEEKAITAEETVPLFITNYPKECKAFYMKEDPDDPRTYRCADLLAPAGYGEIIGGSERETDITKLVTRMEAQDIPLGPYEWYLDLRRYGSVPHSGFGLGVERVVKFVCGIEHIRDTIPFPRTVSRVYP
jgi:asparaginyl-tRNA synthetase